VVSSGSSGTIRVLVSVSVSVSAEYSLVPQRYHSEDVFISVFKFSVLVLVLKVTLSFLIFILKVTLLFLIFILKITVLFLVLVLNVLVPFMALPTCYMKRYFPKIRYALYKLLICYWQMEEMLDCYKRELEQKDHEILRLARYA